MIKNFCKYICYTIYSRACKAAVGVNGKVSKTGAYINFLMLASIIPAILLISKYSNIKALSFLHVLPERSILNVLLYFLVYSGIPMLVIALLIRKSYLENLAITEEEIKKNKRIFWGIIILFIFYFIARIIVHKYQIHFFEGPSNK